MDPELWELLETGESDDEVAAILRLGQAGALPEGVRIVTQFGEIATVRTRRRMIPEIRETPECASMKTAGPPLGPDIELAYEYDAESATELPHDQQRPENFGPTGRGVIVGVVDWGLDFAHPDFRNSDGSTRIVALWDQRGKQRPDSPQPYGYGRVHKSEAIDRALAADDPYAALGYHPADADIGCGTHGAHVASIAVGNGGGGGPVGIAPEAGLIFVHMATWSGKHSAKLGDSVTLLEAIDFISRTAGDRPWVVNLSMGRHGEQHDGTTLVEQGLDAALRAAPGRAICQSAGNYFHRQIHASGQLRPGERRTLAWEVAEADVTANKLEIWYSWRDTLDVEVRSPDGAIFARAGLGERAALREGEREVGTLYQRAREPNTLDNQVAVFLYNNAPAGTWKVSLTGIDVIDGRFHGWIERDAGCASCQSRFSAADADPTSTTGTICNGARTIAVGAYNAHEPDEPVAPFSSAGPTRDGRVKPDLCAPGVSILAARSSPRDAAAGHPLLTRMSGTSMAAPHVTGTVALMFEAAPRPLRIEETHNLLLGSTRKVSAEHAGRAGSGYLDIEAAVQCAREIGAIGAAAKPTQQMEDSAMQNDQTTLAQPNTEPPGGGDYPTESTPRFVFRADEAISAGEVNGSSARLLGAALADLNALPEYLSAAELFDAFNTGNDAPGFSLIGAPGEPLSTEPRPGDVLCRRGEGSFGHAAIVAGSDSWPRDRVAISGLQVENDLPGMYVQVVEGGARPHVSGDCFARRLTDAAGRMLPDQMLLRPERPDFGQNATRRTGDAYNRWIQESLNRVGGATLDVDGILNPETTGAIRRFQQRHGLVVDGVVGPLTEQALIDAGASAPPNAGENGSVPGAKTILESLEGGASIGFEAGEVVLLGDSDADETAEADDGGRVPTSLHMRPPADRPKPPPVHARILWPALGFPAVIAPRSQPVKSPTFEVDATRCITVLLLSDTKFLSKADAARYLRFVPWDQRRRRNIPPESGGSFKEEELTVRNNEKLAVGKGERQFNLTLPVPRNCDKDLDARNHCHGELISFGADHVGGNGITVTLAHYVRDFYRQKGIGIQYLHEVRVSEEASARLQDGLYHLFWNNEAANEKAPSDEMALLLKAFARPRREKLGKLWTTHGEHLMREYEFEYGSFHAPYALLGPHDLPRAEILHPLFVDRRQDPSLKIAQITDTHVDVRNDVYEENLNREGVAASFNNWNRDFVALYEHARRDSDVIFLTGDLIDYGRGHWGLEMARHLGRDDLYHEDRNWFLFYYFLASEKNYTRPVYTILGNHDWRINPYPPFAVAGSPSPRTLFHDYAKFNRDQQTGEDPEVTQRREERARILESYLRQAHGPGHNLKFSYTNPATSTGQLLWQQPLKSALTLAKLALQAQRMDDKGYPAETTVESVAWYLLAINPFFDYSFSLPRKHQVLMLDWADKENVLFPIVVGGQEWPYMIWQAGTASDPGPKARNCLTPIQQHLVSEFVSTPGKAKIICVHAPPIGPYPNWYDTDLVRGMKTYDNPKAARGPVNYGVKYRDGTVEKLNGHPLFAIRPNDAAYGAEADYGSFEEKSRAWFIQELAKPGAGVRMVFSGHIHRNGLHVVHVGSGSEKSATRGRWLLRGVPPHLVRGALPPAVAFTPEGKQGPLYINTTSGGPRGHWHAIGTPVGTPIDVTPGGPPTANQPSRVPGPISFSADPGYTHAELSNDGTIQRVEFRPPQGTQAQPSARIVQQPKTAVPVS